MKSLDNNQFDIDVTSNMYPAMSTGKFGYTFRLGVVLKDSINDDILKKAVIDLAPRFPIMYSHLKKGFFKYTHIAATDFDVVSFGKESPIFLPELYNTEKPMFRINCNGKRIFLDLFHANGDGMAAMTYFKTLITHYFELLEISSEPCDGILNTNETPKDEELCDDYINNYEKGRKSSMNDENAFSLRFPAEKNSEYLRMVCITIPIAELKTIIKPKGFTATDYLSAVLYTAILDHYDVNKQKNPIRISIPINLRPHFGSKSLRNFAYFTNVSLFPRDSLSFDEIMASVKFQLNKAGNKENLLNAIGQIAGLTKSPLVKIAPRFLKDLFIRISYKILGTRKMTVTFSNIGMHKLSKQVEDKIERFEMHLGARLGFVNTSAVGFGNKLSMCLCFSSEDRSIQNKFVEILRNDRLNIEVHETIV